jgi:hypothetical protein
MISQGSKHKMHLLLTDPSQTDMYNSIHKTCDSLRQGDTLNNKKPRRYAGFRVIQRHRETS